MTKKLITLLLALTMVFACAVPSFATVVPTENSASSYVQGAASNYEQDGTFVVYLDIYSGIYDSEGPINTVYTVTMGTETATSATYTVADVLTQAHAQNSNLSFNVLIPYSGHDSWLQSVTDTSVSTTSFEAMPLYYTTNTYYCAWMYRINGYIPYFTHTNTSGQTVTEGCTITDAYVTPGDVVNLYYCNAYNRNFATKPRAVVMESSSFDTNSETYSATLQVLQCELWLDDINDTEWTIADWSALANKTLNILIDGVSTSITTDDYGKFTIDGLSSGDHTAQFVTTTKAYKVYSNLSNPKYKVAKELGLYCRFNIEE